jgi:acetyl-CoA acetyltransferase
VCELHDCFSANELITYEALGFAAEGEGHHLVEANATTVEGATTALQHNIALGGAAVVTVYRPPTS